MLGKIDYYRVNFGDTLESISEKQYGSRQFYGVIFRHNSTVIVNPNLLMPGTMLAIPKLGGDLVNAIIQNFVEDDDND